MSNFRDVEEYINRRRIKNIYQRNKNECAVAALLMLLRYYKMDINYNELCSAFSLSEEGCSALHLIEVAKKCQFYAVGIKIDIQTLVRNNTPCIIYLKSRHYVVYKNRRKDKVYFNDPSQGKRVLTVSEFEKMFSGIVIMLKPMKQVKRLERNFRFHIKIYDIIMYIGIFIFNFLLAYGSNCSFESDNIFSFMLISIIMVYGVKLESSLWHKMKMFQNMDIYKKDLLGYPFLFFVYQESGLNSDKLILNYATKVVQGTFVLSYLLLYIYYDFIKGVCLGIGIFCCVPLLLRKSRFYKVSLNFGKVSKINFAILFIFGMVKIILGYGEYSDLCNFECYTMFINCVGYRYQIEHIRFKFNSVLSE